MKTGIGIVLVLVILGAGAYWIMSQNAFSPESQNQTEINTQTADYRHFVDTQEGVSFDIPKDWTQDTLPEAGYPSFVSPDYSFGAMKLRGAYIAYHLFSSPETYTGTPDEYLEFLKESSTGWSETSFAGHTVWTRTAVVQQGSEALPASGTYTVRSIVGRIGNQFIDIHFADATGNYHAVFEAFLKSFKFN